MATSRLVSRAGLVWAGLRGVAFVFTPRHYTPAGSFYKGVAEGEVDPAFGPLEALRLSIQTDSPVWVILSEVRSAGCRDGTNQLDHLKPQGTQCRRVVLPAPPHPEPDSSRSF